jgi:hypothetical protein
MRRGREERKKSVYKRERLSRYVCVLRACVICYLFFFFLFTRIYILNITLIFSKRLFSWSQVNAFLS